MAASRAGTLGPWSAVDGLNTHPVHQRHNGRNPTSSLSEASWSAHESPKGPLHVQLIARGICTGLDPGALAGE